MKKRLLRNLSKTGYQNSRSKKRGRQGEKEKFIKRKEKSITRGQIESINYEHGI